MSSDIHVACKNGDYSFVDGWMKQVDVDVNVKERRTGWTPLHCALDNDNYEIASLLLSHPDICVLSATSDLGTALHYAARTRAPLSDPLRKIFESLLSKGLNI